MRERIGILVFLVCAGTSLAQDYPQRPVRIVVPFPPGGPTDILARAIATPLTSALGQTVLVENRPGAGGIIGVEWVARAAPDGYTLGWGTTGTHVINPSLYAKLPYDVFKDFAPIILVAQGTSVLVTHPSVPVRSVPQLVALARERPGKLSFASAGIGATSHLAGEMLKTMAKVDIVHVPFKGATPAITGLISGEVDLAILDMPGVLPHIRSERLRALGVAGKVRSPVLPQLPTVAESGLAGYEASSSHALYAPVNTPHEVVQRLNAEVGRIIREHGMQKRMAAQGADPVGGPPERLAQFLRVEAVRWAGAVRASGAKVD